MKRTTIAGLVLAAASVIFISACDRVPTTYTEWTPPETTDVQVKVEIVLLDSQEQLNSACGRILGVNGPFLGCAQKYRQRGEEMFSCTVYGFAPKDFNDTQPLTILGHELLHCYGAKHE